ncbi:MAG TPA: nitrilase-related carbon-nitrogen hydrolase [Candidatus Saccharimonadales bacterium]|nr:nitrilase-related carbon-nitrogen hydrolase [Candidatus Saccharimonadales bacterium]
MNPSPKPPPTTLNRWAMFGLSFAAVASFQLAYSVYSCAFLFVIFFYCLFRLANVRTSRQAFYIGLTIGLAAYGFQLRFFWTIFQFAAVPLFVVVSFWLGLFLSLGRLCLKRFGLIAWACAAPFLWTALEYFRSELYYLRFSWLNAGYAFSDSSYLPYVASYGVYGIGFLLMTVAAFFGVVQHLGRPQRIAAIFVVAALWLYPLLSPSPRISPRQTLEVTGVQMEFPIPAEVVMALDRANKRFPQTDLLILSEYTFMGPVPEMIKSWCRKHHKYLVVGGEDPVSSSQYYNTVFVINPAGEIVFKQAKCIPVQFFKDGLPAREQRLWISPWGKLGFGICYDDCYTRVTDELVRQGAQALIFPTMDITDWGSHQHQLHARMAPMRAAEYAMPVVRLCSSGISQYADFTGRVRNSAPFPGQGAILHAQIQLASHGRMRPDRWLAVLSLAITVALSGWLAVESFLLRS